MLLAASGEGAGRGLQAACALWCQQRCGRRLLLLLSLAFSSPRCHSIQTLSCLSPQAILPHSSKKAGRRGSKMWGQGASAPRTPRRVTGCSFCRGAWLRSCALSSGHEANASEMRTQNLLCARLQRGRRVVVWLVLIYVFVFKLLHDGARQRSRLFNKSIRGLDTWGPAVGHLRFSPSSSKVHQEAFLQSGDLHLTEEAARSHSGATPLPEHLVNLASDPSGKSLTR